MPKNRAREELEIDLSVNVRKEREASRMDGKS